MPHKEDALNKEFRSLFIIRDDQSLAYKISGFNLNYRQWYNHNWMICNFKNKITSVEIPKRYWWSIGSDAMPEMSNCSRYDYWMTIDYLLIFNGCHHKKSWWRI